MAQKIQLHRFLDVGKPALHIASRDFISCRDSESIKNAIDIMLRGHGRIPVVDRKGEFAGMITSTGILDYLGAHSRHEIFMGMKSPLHAPVGKVMDTYVQALKSKANIKVALGAFRKHGNDAFPIIRGKKLVGVVSKWDIVQQLNSPLGLKVKDAMMPKPMIVSEGWSVFDVAKMMVRGGYRRFPVVKEGILMGMVTPHEILYHLRRSESLHRLKKEETEIRHVMQKRVAALVPEQDLGEAIEMMGKSRTTALPVAEEGEFLGLLTESDVIDFLE
jgi:acetoin utilization protein AcuB